MLTASQGEVNLTIEWDDTSPFAWQREALPPEYTSPYLLPDGQPSLRVYHLDQVYIFNIPNTVNFFVFPERVVCQSLERTDAALMENTLVGAISAFCLEQRGIYALHASSVAMPKGAVAFMADSSSGKSSLTAFAVQSGLPLVTDDILAVGWENDRFLVYPGLPNIRLYPEVARSVLDNFTGLERVHPLSEKLRVPVGDGRFGRFRSDPLPLAAIYLLFRDQANASVPISIATLSPSKALMALVSKSFLPRTLSALSMQAKRMPGLAELAASVPIKQLSFPSGYEHMPAILAALHDDLNNPAQKPSTSATL